MSAFLSVQHAARRLGVSPVTIRRWTATGFLPCTRTAGGHRRIATDDIEELTRAIGGSSHVAARRARERELDTIVETSLAVASEVDLQPLLAEIARRTTRLLDCDFCAVSTYDPATRLVQALAEYDGGGERLPDTETYDVRQFPLTRKVLAEHVAAVVNVDDPRADAAEVAALRSGGDRSLLMLPLVYRGESIGLLEAIDARRARSYTRQELRLCQAVAGQAAVALHNTSLRAASRSGRDELRGLCAALRDLAPALAAALAQPDRDVALERLADAVCDVLGAVSCWSSRRTVRPAPRGLPPAAASGTSSSVATPVRRCRSRSRCPSRRPKDWPSCSTCSPRSPPRRSSPAGGPPRPGRRASPASRRASSARAAESRRCRPTAERR